MNIRTGKVYENSVETWLIATIAVIIISATPFESDMTVDPWNTNTLMTGFFLHVMAKVLIC